MRLAEVREKIDGIDREIAALFQRRLDACAEAAACKMNQEEKIWSKEIETRKLAMIVPLGRTAFERESLAELYGQLLAISRRYQYDLADEYGEEALTFTRKERLPDEGATAVFQGVEGAYSHAAMLQYFGGQVKSFHVPAFSGAMEAVSEGRADYAVLPIENSSAGQVGDVYDLLISYEVAIIGEIYLPVSHCLLGLPGGSVSQIRRVYSHPQGLMQCQNYLGRHPDWQQVSQANTAVAARRVVEEQDPSAAAIAGELAGKLQGLEVLERGVNDNPQNTTRFIVVSGRKEYRAGANKVSICFELSHESGTLYNTLSHIIYNGLNMEKIESRPIPDRPFEYRFFVDFAGSLSDSSVQNAIRGIGEESLRMKILGNY